MNSIEIDFLLSKQLIYYDVNGTFILIHNVKTIILNLGDQQGDLCLMLILWMVYFQLVCVCGASSEPLRFHEMVHYITTNALV